MRAVRFWLAWAAVGLPWAGLVIADEGGAVVRDTSVVLARKIRPSIVKITQIGREGVDGVGTGFVIHANGLIATNLHVIGEARPLEVELSDGSRLRVTAVHATDASTDLAVLKVDAENLTPLVLGDSDEIEQGDRIVAMGTPEGLEFSLVEGVISATRELEIEGVPMLQVAVPIERGNSGGPMLSMEAEVLGVLTLKSLKTDNLGFAMPVNVLKDLVEKPNPVPMSRWLTIGALDARQWRPLMGGRWSQRAGVIQAGEIGEGFGGRTLCLSTEEVPEGGFEVAVEVRLEDESGAAGLAFCADGGQRHYGFYPSAGKIRLTRFDGADVYSWDILWDQAVNGYQRGDWNALRVRVDGGWLTGWVNGVEVLRMEDDGLRGGQVGLCKFRDTVADFRGFQLGTDLAPKPLPPERVAAVDRQVDGLLAEEVDAAGALSRLAPFSAVAQERVRERRRILERQAEVLRHLEEALHRQSVTQALLRELAKPDEEVRLLRCALLLARHDNPQIDVGRYLKVFKQLVAELKADPAIKAGTEAAVKRLNEFLFDENGFHGSRHDFGSRSNSYINEVMDDREGLPIALSVLYLELADALGIEGVFGVGLPGRFMVGYRTSPESELQLIDVFERGQPLSVDEASMQWNNYYAFEEAVLRPASKQSIIVRMIKNLLGGAMDAESAAEVSLPYLDLTLAIEPDSPAERFARARMREVAGDQAGAREDVSWLIANPGNLPPEMLQNLERWYRSLEE